MGRKALALKDFIERCPNDIEILEYAGFVQPCTWRCIRCGETYVKKASNLITKSGRPPRTNCTCSGHTVSAKLATPLKTFLRQIAHLPYTPLNYTALKTHCDFQCGDCGTIFCYRPFEVRSGRAGCPTCKSKAFAEEYRQRLREEFPHITLIGEYNGFRHRSLHRCDCGYEWMSKPFIAKTKIRKAGCKFCDYRAGGPKLKDLRFGRRSVKVQGYEDDALRYLLRCGVNPSKLAVSKEEGVPNIAYTWQKRERMYWPDFYHVEKNIIVEVKSLFTLLSVDFKKTCAKAKACLDQGYRFKLLLVIRDSKAVRVLTLPASWMYWSQSKAIQWIIDKHPSTETRIKGLSKSNPYL